MIIEAICGAMAGMYVFHEVKGAIAAVKEYREVKAETARKLIELEEAKKDLARFKEVRAKLEREKAEAEESRKFYRDLCDRADLLIKPEDTLENFDRKMQKENSVIVFDD